MCWGTPSPSLSFDTISIPSKSLRMTLRAGQALINYVSNLKNARAERRGFVLGVHTKANTSVFINGNWAKEASMHL